MFCLLDKGSRLFFKYLKRNIHQVTFGKIDLNNSFLQNDINPWSTEDVRTQWMSQKPLNTISPQDTVKKMAEDSSYLVSLFACWLGCFHAHSCPAIPEVQFKSGFVLAWPSLARPRVVSPGTGVPEQPCPRTAATPCCKGTSPTPRQPAGPRGETGPWQQSELGTKSLHMGNMR